MYDGLQEDERHSVRNGAFVSVEDTPPASPRSRVTIYDKAEKATKLVAAAKMIGGGFVGLALGVSGVLVWANGKASRQEVELLKTVQSAQGERVAKLEGSLGIVITQNTEILRSVQRLTEERHDSAKK